MNFIERIKEKIPFFDGGNTGSGTPVKIEEKPQEKKEVVTSEKNWLGITTEKVEHLPGLIFVDFKPGSEDEVKKNAKSDIFQKVESMAWGKKGVTYRIYHVVGHPRLDDGYLYEVQQNGDGGSYIEQMLDFFKSPKNDYFWVQCAKSKWALVELKNGFIDTSITTIKPIKDDYSRVGEYSKKPNKMRPLYVDSYAFFYISVMLFFGSLFSVAFASMFKYVWLDEEEKFVDNNYYQPKTYVNADLLGQIRGSYEKRPVAFRYNKSKGWHVVFEERRPGGIAVIEQRALPGKQELSAPVELEFIAEGSQGGNSNDQ